MLLCCVVRAEFHTSIIKILVKYQKDIETKTLNSLIQNLMKTCAQLSNLYNVMKFIYFLNSSFW